MWHIVNTALAQNTTISQVQSIFWLLGKTTRCLICMKNISLEESTYNTALIVQALPLCPSAHYWPPAWPPWSLAESGFPLIVVLVEVRQLRVLHNDRPTHWVRTGYCLPTIGPLDSCIPCSHSCVGFRGCVLWWLCGSLLLHSPAPRCCSAHCTKSSGACRSGWGRLSGDLR